MTAPDALSAAAPEPAIDGADPLAQVRAHLVRNLMDVVVLPATRLSANERSLTADIILQVLDKVEEPLRCDVARRIARVPEAPASLIEMLLLDEPAVAGELIRKADSLPEALLIKCAQRGETAHRDLLARRLDLTTSVADVILSFNEPEIAKLLLRRDNFQFSPGAIDQLIARSPADAEMQELLLRRREIEPAHGFIMFWWVDAPNRKRILARFAVDRTIVQDALQELYPTVFRGAAPDPFVKEILVMLDRRHRPRGLNGEPVSMDICIKTLAAARKYPAQEIIQAVGMIAGVSRELVARVLRDPGVEPFAVLCKSLGMPRQEFFRIVSQQTAESPVSPERAEELLGIFDSMARDYARAVLRYWDWDGNPRIAHITRLLGITDDDV